MAKEVPTDETRSIDDRKRVLLDTNIWRYIIDNEAQGALLRGARDGSYQVQIAPGVLYEALRLKNVTLRAALVRLMTNRRFQRLMPEAYSESIEILREIERARPDWLRKVPDLESFNRLKKDWTRTRGGFWARSERSSERSARHVSQVEGSMMDDARTEAHASRKEMIAAKWTHMPPMDTMLAGFPTPLLGWRGDLVEAWRIDSFLYMTRALAHKDHPYRDWISPFIELDSWILHSRDWVEFWLYLAHKNALPRQWLRWAHSFVQRFRKVSQGSPSDAQLFTYFIETDIVITADKALVDILEECRPYSPCKLPEGKLVPAGAFGINILLRLLET